MDDDEKSAGRMCGGDAGGASSGSPRAPAGLRPLKPCDGTAADGHRGASGGAAATTTATQRCTAAPYHASVRASSSSARPAPVASSRAAATSEDELTAAHTLSEMMWNRPVVRPPMHSSAPSRQRYPSSPARLRAKRPPGRPRKSFTTPSPARRTAPASPPHQMQSRSRSRWKKFTAAPGHKLELTRAEIGRGDRAAAAADDIRCPLPSCSKRFGSRQALAAHLRHFESHRVFYNENVGHRYGNCRVRIRSVKIEGACAASTAYDGGGGGAGAGVGDGRAARQIVDGGGGESSDGSRESDGDSGDGDYSSSGGGGGSSSSSSEGLAAESMLTMKENKQRSNRRGAVLANVTNLGKRSRKPPPSTHSSEPATITPAPTTTTTTTTAAAAAMPSSALASSSTASSSPSSRVQLPAYPHAALSHITRRYYPYHYHTH